MRRGDSRFTIKHAVDEVRPTNDLTGPFQAKLRIEEHVPGGRTDILIVFVRKAGQWTYKSHRLGWGDHIQWLSEGMAILEAIDITNGVKDASSPDRTSERVQRLLQD
jgi:hypothetical protein